MQGSHQAYGNGVPMQHYVDARFRAVEGQLTEIVGSTRRIEARVVALEARWWRLVGAGSAVLLVANYVAGKYL